MTNAQPPNHGTVSCQDRQCNSFIDTLSILLGSERLLLAMASEPEKVKAALGKLMPYGKVIYDRLYSITNPVNNGSIDWMGLWCRKVLTTQCDLSVMISPQMFDEFVKDDLQSTYDYVDYGIYHLDGKEEIRHLDILLSMDKIKLIQWVPSNCTEIPTTGIHEMDTSFQENSGSR